MSFDANDMIGLWLMFAVNRMNHILCSVECHVMCVTLMVDLPNWCNKNVRLVCDVHSCVQFAFKQLQNLFLWDTWTCFNQQFLMMMDVKLLSHCNWNCNDDLTQQHLRKVALFFSPLRHFLLTVCRRETLCSGSDEPSISHQSLPSMIQPVTFILNKK